LNLLTLKFYFCGFCAFFAAISTLNGKDEETEQQVSMFDVGRSMFDVHPIKE